MSDNRFDVSFQTVNPAVQITIVGSESTIIATAQASGEEAIGISRRAPYDARDLSIGLDLAIGRALEKLGKKFSDRATVRVVAANEKRVNAVTERAKSRAAKYEHDRNASRNRRYPEDRAQRVKQAVDPRVKEVEAAMFSRFPEVGTRVHSAIENLAESVGHVNTTYGRGGVLTENDRESANRYAAGGEIKGTGARSSYPPAVDGCPE